MDRKIIFMNLFQDQMTVVKQGVYMRMMEQDYAN